MMHKLQSAFMITTYTEQADMKSISEDDYQLLPEGGCMLLTSPDLVT